MNRSNAHADNKLTLFKAQKEPIQVFFSHHDDLLSFLYKCMLKQSLALRWTPKAMSALNVTLEARTNWLCTTFVLTKVTAVLKRNVSNKSQEKKR